ncbi:bifunctional adenosylcobinamide kinase/adenosylcobinamide-phosphate guanylyltransferase [Bacillus canaveralius]|uniref:bifunctional adenosylcobinamide kinase/adenosylcobinamide-phosphate guanylyltransferase n=1 Tax=Bacillus canaveralius TaxID=1403243 RepID=UPI0021AD5FC4|nr:bifunctional adenosylcobinamide kinase/adenosylcobinamide-phosphate guanylyltransferase [Bacillus canaveralius]
MAASSIIFITGGVRSGKSRFAEEVAVKLAEQAGSSLLYLASGRTEDEEMKRRISHHRQERAESGSGWITLECPDGLEQAASELTPNSVVLFDCLTTHLNNRLFSEQDGWLDRDYCQHVKISIKESIMTIAVRCKAMIIVSNEILNESIRDNEVIYTYSKILGELHQWIVRQARSAYLVESGLTVEMKGEPQ